MVNPLPRQLVSEQTDYSACRDRVRGLRNRSREMQRDEAYFQWRYASRPVGPRVPPPFVAWIRDEDGADIAAASVIPHAFTCHGQTRHLGMIGDISVDGPWQGRGLATRLLGDACGAARKRGLDGCFVLPNAEVAGALTRAGFVHVGSIRRFVLPLRFGPGGSNHRAVNMLIRGASNILCALQRNGAGRQSRRHRVVESSKPLESIGDVWSAVSVAPCSMALRNRAFLSWRFVEKPGANYRFVHVLQGEQLRAYAVVHHERGSLIVDDFLCIDAESGRTLRGMLVHIGIFREDCKSIQLRVSDARGLQAMHAAPLWVARPDFQSVMVADFVGAPPPRLMNWFVTPADKDV